MPQLWHHPPEQGHYLDHQVLVVRKHIRIGADCLQAEARSKITAGTARLLRALGRNGAGGGHAGALPAGGTSESVH